MLPGVIKAGSLGDALANLQKSSICSIAALSGTSPTFQLSRPLAVGTCDMSPTEVKASGGKGRFILILHTAEDKLV